MEEEEEDGEEEERLATQEETAATAEETEDEDEEEERQQPATQEEEGTPAEVPEEARAAGAAIARRAEEGGDLADLVLGDAKNGFNLLNRYAMLWTVRHKWPAGSRFALNCYRHYPTLIVRRPGRRECLTILSRDGVTQGDPLAMHLYGLMLTPLSEQLRDEFPDALQPWYADDFAAVGPPGVTGPLMLRLKELGPARGYHLSLDKSVYVRNPKTSEEEARRRTIGLGLKHSQGERYLGGFIGSEGALKEWVLPKVEGWVHGVQTLARFAKRYPQSAYAGLAMSLQSEWQYLQRVTPGVSAHFAPIERAIREEFLPALLGEEEISDALRARTRLATKQAGIGIPDPQATADRQNANSRRCCRLLTTSLLLGGELSGLEHKAAVKAGRRTAHYERVGREELEKAHLEGRVGSMARRAMRRSAGTGRWLTTVPNLWDDTALSMEEFRDGLRIRLGLRPQHLPEKCDGCGAPFTLEHALNCKVGGLVTLRHNFLRDMWGDLCGTCTRPSAVSSEPLINQRRAAGERVQPATAQGTPTQGGAAEEEESADRGDVGCVGFWAPQKLCIFDMQITNTDAASHRSMDPEKVIARLEKRKKDKYLQPCLEKQRHFTPMVYSVDGLMGKEAEAATQWAAWHLSRKWKRDYGAVCGHIRARMSITLVRAVSLLLRGARNRAPPRSSPPESGTAALATQYWLE